MSVKYFNGVRNVRLSVRNLSRGADLLALLITLNYRIIRVDV